MTCNQKAESVFKGYREYLWLGFVTVAIAFGAGGTWAAMAPLDSAAIASGQVTLETNRKPIQHLEGGIVHDVLVKEAQRVKAGQILFQLDPVRSAADVEMLEVQLITNLAKARRLVAERNGEPVISWTDAFQVFGKVARSNAIKASEQRLFTERLSSLQSQQSILNSRMEQATQEIEGRQKQKLAYEAQAQSLADDLKRLGTLAAKRLYPKTKIKALERERAKYIGETGRAEADIARARERIAESKLQIIRLQQERREAAALELSDVDLVISDKRQKLKIARQRLEALEIRAPHDGIVQSVKVHFSGAVIRAGETLAEIVPVTDELLISARVSPLDIDSVMPNQRAEIRLPAFSGRQIPIMFGSVATISADTMVDETTGTPYYLARIVVRQSEIPTKLASRLVPGMPADVLIATGERTMLDYLTDPLTSMFVKSMREK